MAPSLIPVDCTKTRIDLGKYLNGLILYKRVNNEIQPVPELKPASCLETNAGRWVD